MEYKWYILFIRKNSEFSVIEDIKNNLEEKSFSHLKFKIGNVSFLKYEDDNGSVKNSVPGYIFVECEINQEIVNFLQSIKNVVGFLNYDKKNPNKMPSYLSDLEVKNFSLLSENAHAQGQKAKSNSMKEKKKVNTPRSYQVKLLKSDKNENIEGFKIGDIVSIKKGLFKNSRGSIIQINKNFLTINVDFLGRITPVSIEFLHCEKI